MPVIMIVNDMGKRVPAYETGLLMGCGYFDPHEVVERVLVDIRRAAARAEQESPEKAERKSAGRMRKAAQCFLDWLQTARPPRTFPVELVDELDDVVRSVCIASCIASFRKAEG